MTPSPSSESAPGAFPEASCHEPLGTDSCSLSLPFFFFFFGSSAAASGSLASPTTDQPVGEAAAAAGRMGPLGVVRSDGGGEWGRRPPPPPRGPSQDTASAAETLTSRGAAGPAMKAQDMRRRLSAIGGHV